MVEGIEEARAKLQPPALLKAEGALDGNVPGVKAGSHERITRTVPEGARIRRGNVADRIRHGKIAQLVMDRAGTVWALAQIAHAGFVAEG